jgi:hypothetical protein
MEYVMTIKHMQFPIDTKSKKPSSMTYEDCKKLDLKTIFTLQDYFTNKIYFHVFQENTTQSIGKNLYDLCKWDTIVSEHAIFYEVVI